MNPQNTQPNQNFQPGVAPLNPPQTPQSQNIQNPFPAQIQPIPTTQQNPQLQLMSAPQQNPQLQFQQNPQLQPQPFTQQPVTRPLMQPTMQPSMQQPTQMTNQPIATNQPPAQDSKTPARGDHPLSTHGYLAISELRDGMAIMKDGSFRVVIACQSINFDLMSEAEREGIEYSFQNFLNSLNFTTQILVRSQRIDISPYIDSLIEIRRKNENMLLGVLMDDYINFIDALSEEANIMDKSFFVIIPYYSSADAEKLVQETKNFFTSFSRKTAPEITKIDRQTYNTAITEINKRADAVMSGLFRIGIRSVKLNTRELAQLYYNFNNPDTSVREPLVDFTKITNLYTKKA